MPANIKPLRAQDLESVIAIDKAITGSSRRGFFEKRLAAALEQPQDYVYVGLHEDGKLAGYALAKLESGEFGQPGAKASFDAIGVGLDHRGHGVGHQLMSAVEEILTHKKVEYLTTHVDWSDPAMLGFFSESGFLLAPRNILTRDTSLIARNDDQEFTNDPHSPEIDHSAPESDEPDALSQERVLVRSMQDSDLQQIIRIDKKITANDRSPYYRLKQDEALHRTGIRVSLIAEMEGFVVGFIMVRVDYGDFGNTSSEAVMDALGVDPDYQNTGIGSELMTKLMTNLANLKVDKIRTEIDWNDTSLVAYLGTTGFVPAQALVLSRAISG